MCPPPNHLYDLIILRDVIEHVEDQPRLMARLAELLAPDGVLFVAYPPWRMPFGGHQQMAVSRFAAHFHWLHLLPGPLYPWA
uniref:class I SAM-dependent methyltransferase n=1 Tax=Alistipes shahii TaxID=328814 RepID=UPI003FEF9222